MRISAIVPHFYEQREANLPIIVHTLRSGTVPPDEIIVWNNTARSLSLKDAYVVQSPRNVGAKGRLLAALMARGERLLFIDNDVTVQRQTIENLMYWKLLSPDVPRRGVVTLEGRVRLPSHPYSRWPKVYGHGLNNPERVFLSLGRGEMVDRVDLHHALRFFPFEESSVMDDMLLSSAYKRSGLPVFVVPCVRGKSSLEELPMGGVGLCKTPDFMEQRNRVAMTIECDPETLRAQAESA